MPPTALQMQIGDGDAIEPDLLDDCAKDLDDECSLGRMAEIAQILRDMAAAQRALLKIAQS